MEPPSTRRFCLTLHYDGGAFHGWQLQPTERSVQGELEEVLERLFTRPVRVIGSGRTDRGVHAVGQVVAVDAPEKWTPGELRRALNALLSDDVWVSDARLAASHGRRREQTMASFSGRLGVGVLAVGLLLGACRGAPDANRPVTSPTPSPTHGVEPPAPTPGHTHRPHSDVNPPPRRAGDFRVKVLAVSRDRTGSWGEEVRTWIEGLGELRQRCVAGVPHITAS